MEKNYIEIPCNVGDIAYEIIDEDVRPFIHKTKVDGISICSDGIWINVFADDGLRMWYREKDIGKDLFFIEDDAKECLNNRLVGYK